MSSYPIAAEALDLEIYQLACIFAASQELSRVSKSIRTFSTLVDTFEFSEASRKLISISVAIRSSLDSNPTPKKETNVGTLTKDTSNPVEVKLEFREACNKIIHALDINFFDISGDYSGLSWSIELFGNYGNKNWKATIDLQEFIKEAHKLT
jgi:hypothetical protein